MIKKIICIATVLTLLLAGCTMAENKGDSTSGQPQESNSSGLAGESTVNSDGAGDTTEISTTVPPAKDVNGTLSTKKVVWGPGKTVEHQRPADPVNLNELYSQYNAKFLLDDTKEILLTFDEGYENGFTPSILNTLKEKKISAVFFVTYDFVKSNPELVQRMIDEGHVLGNHTYRHKTMDEIDLDTATEEVQFLHNYIKENFNYTMKYFRFPKGEFSESSLNLVKELGYTSLFWSFAYADWDTNNVMAKDAAFEKITSSTHNGAIFLLHAVSETNAAILGDVIDNVQQQGYMFKSLA